MKNNIEHPETLSIHSIENFLNIREVKRLISMCKKELNDYRGEFETVHPSEKFTKEEAVRIYEPNGRVELNALSSKITDVLNAAVEKNLPYIQNIFPKSLPSSALKNVPYRNFHQDRICLGDHLSNHPK